MLGGRPAGNSAAGDDTVSTDVEDSLILHPLPGDLLRAATAVVCTQPDADLLLDMLGLGGVAP